jgi:hypothetical protein
LLLEIQHALAGKEVDGWPASPPEIAGTLAHAVRAGVELRSEMLDYVRGHVSDIASAPWHAGQVVAALGREAPEAIWHACLDDLDREPWAPWTVLGFHAREAPVDEAARAIQGLIDRVRPKRPNEGAVLVRDFAETAVTALTAEALTAYEQAAGALTAIQRARTFLSRWQLLPATTPAAFAVGAETDGAFVATPTSTVLRGDVTAHALLAML